MTNVVQPKIRPTTNTGLEANDEFSSDRVRPVANSANGSSSTAIVAILALAVVAALGYFYFVGTTSTITETPPVVTQESQPAQPVPADPPPATVQDPVPATPAPAPVAPAPVAPAN